MLERRRSKWCFLAYALLGSCPLFAQELTARRITSPSDLATGKGVLGTVGDYLLANDRIRVIIDDVGKRQGFAESGGNIVDAVRRDVNIDLLTQLITYFDNTFPRQAVYRRIEILKDGSDGREARIRASGVEMKDRNLQIVTEYSLHPREFHVTVQTTVTNGGTQTLRDFDLGDAVQWGFTEHFAAGHGFDIGGRNLSNVEWLAGPGDGVSYGYTVRSGTFFGPNGSNWSDANVMKVELAPNASATYERYLVVGTGDIASVTDQVFLLRNRRTAPLSGRVQEESTGARVQDASINVQTGDGKPYNIIKPAQDGSFRANLPPGRYLLVASAIGRKTPTPVAVQVTEGSAAEAVVSISQTGRLRFTVSDADTRKPLPAKLTIRGLGDTPDPFLGPGYQARGAVNVIFNHTGSGETLVPPGMYEIAVSRGIEYTIQRRRVSIQPGRAASVAAALRRVVDTSGYISGDYHLHSEYSTDSNVTLRDKVIGLVAEGVEFAVSSDHNNIADYKAAIRELGLDRELKSTMGNEVTLSGTIHFNVFPLVQHPERHHNGAIDPSKMKVQEMIDEVRKDPGDEVVQINHPRAGNIGYFTTSKFDSMTVSSPDPNFTLDFDAIEVFNGKRVPEAEEVMRDWFNLLNAGYTFAATGNSDSHKLVSEEAGYPRNFIYLGKDDPSQVTEDEVVAATKRHKIIVSNGPFPTILVNGKHTVGDRLSSGGKSVIVSVRLQSAPWIDISQVSLIGNGELVESRLVRETALADKGTETFNVRPKVDTWYVVVVRGNKPLSPIVPDLGEREVLPFAFTNPFWVDADGDGKFTPLRPRK